jgi:hypothetical protein
MFGTTAVHDAASSPARAALQVLLAIVPLLPLLPPLHQATGARAAA